MLWLAIAIGGSIGAMARFAVSSLLAPAQIHFPLATLLVNSVGALLMGICYVVIVEKMLIGAIWRHILMTGCLGAFTTFSTFSIETLHLLQAGQWHTALIYTALSLVLSVGAVYLGVSMTEHLL